MSPHNVNNEICAKLGQIVRAYDRVDGPVLAKPYIVCSRFILQQPIHAWSIFQSPFHMSDKANQWKALFFRVLHDRFEQSQRLVLIESAIAKVRISPCEYLELATLAGRANVDAGRRQSLDMLVTSFGIDSMDGLLAAFEAVLNERHQHPILVIMTVEKCADMTGRAKY